MDVTLALQILTLVVAAVGPWLAFRFAKRLALGNNRQAWLDALRTDVAELISLSDIVTSIRGRMATLKEVRELLEAETVLRDQLGKLQTLRFRIRLRLRSGNPRHDRLIAAVEQMVVWRNEPGEDRTAKRAEIVNATEVIVQRVWTTIESGR